VLLRIGEIVAPIKYTIESPFIEVEKMVSLKIEKKFGLILKKLKMNYHLDFAGFKNEEIKIFGEIKVRSHNYGKYPTVMVSAYKFLGLKQILQTFNKPVFLFIQYNDGLYYWRFNIEDKYTLRWGGRTDRNSHKDIEPMAHFPIRYFKELK